MILKVDMFILKYREKTREDIWGMRENLNDRILQLYSYINLHGTRFGGGWHGDST